MAQVAGQRTTGQTISEGRLYRQIDDNIVLIDPDKAPLVTLTMKMRKRKPVVSPRIEWLEDDYVQRFGQLSTTTVNGVTGSTSVIVTDGTVFKVGDVFYVPKAGSSSTAGELCRVTAISTNTLTVVRDVGGAGVDTISASSYLRLIGSAYEEGGALPAMKSTTPVTRTNYTQIIRTVVDFTNTQLASKAYGTLTDSERAYYHRKFMVEHLEQMNAALIWGRKSESLTGGPSSKPIRTTDGINSVISTNITDANGILTRRTFENWCRTCFRYGNKSQKLLLASPLLCQAINEWGNSFLMVKPGETRFGVRIQEIETSAGTLMMVRDWMLEDPASGANGFSGWGFILDMDCIEYNYLAANGESRDTKVMQDVVQDGADRKVDQILTECSFKIKQEKRHGKIFNITSYQAA